MPTSLSREAAAPGVEHRGRPEQNDPATGSPTAFAVQDGAPSVTVTLVPAPEGALWRAYDLLDRVARERTEASSA